MHLITSSFLDKSLPPLDRIYRIWFSTFALRIWRFWLCSEENYTLGNNFISSNAYLCVEVCAHSLVLVALKLRNILKPELFLPWLYSSQSCEAYFRAARSCSSSHSTQVNFSLKEFLCSRCRKIDASLRLTASGVKNGLIYPRCKRPFNSSLEFTENLSENSFGIGESSRVFIPKALPSLEEIEVTIL